MNLMKTEIVQLLELEQKSNYFVIKKNNSYMCLSDKNFRFLDISNFLAPGLQLFQVSESLSNKRKQILFSLRMV